MAGFLEPPSTVFRQCAAKCRRRLLAQSAQRQSRPNSARVRIAAGRTWSRAGPGRLMSVRSTRRQLVLVSETFALRSWLFVHQNSGLDDSFHIPTRANESTCGPSQRQAPKSVLRACVATRAKSDTPLRLRLGCSQALSTHWVGCTQRSIRPAAKCDAASMPTPWRRRYAVWKAPRTASPPGADRESQATPAPRVPTRNPGMRYGRGSRPRLPRYEC